MRLLLDRISLRWQLLAGFGIVIGLLLIVVLTNAAGLRNATAMADDVRIVAANTIRIERAGRLFSDARRYVLRFGETGDAEAASHARTQLATLQQDLDNAIRTFLVEDRRVDTKRLREVAATYAAAFERVTALRATRMEADQRMDELGLAGRKAITQVVDTALAAGNTAAAARAGQAQEQFILARLAASRFRLTGKHEHAERARLALQQLASHLDVLGQDGGLGELKSLPQRYQDAFGRSVAATEAYEGLVTGEMGEAAGRFFTILADLQQRQQKGMEGYAAQERQVFDTISQTGIAVSGVAVLIGGGLALLIGTVIGRALQGMSGAMQQLAAGDLEVSIPALGNRHELGRMARAVQVFRENAIRTRMLEAQSVESARLAAAEKQAAMGRMADNFEREVGAVVEGVGRCAEGLEGAARGLSDSAQRSGRDVATVTEQSGRASADVQSVAAAAEELASSVAEISRRVADGAGIARVAAQEARTTDATVQGLNDAAQRIGDVVRLIGAIAGQTNLLALNATIEAARAGEAGKGFAVVASEVKTLAAQTAKATEEIGNQIAAMQSTTLQAVGALRGISTTVAKIDEVTAAIAAAVEEQGAATREIARTASSVAEATGTVSERIGEVREASDAIGRSAGTLLAASGDLSQQVGALRGRAAEFLTAVRAA